MEQVLVHSAAMPDHRRKLHESVKRSSIRWLWEWVFLGLIPHQYRPDAIQFVPLVCADKNRLLRFRDEQFKPTYRSLVPQLFHAADIFEMR